MASYSWESGQVYSETSLPESKVLSAKWFTFSRGSDRAHRFFRHKEGAASLSDMAMRSVLVNRTGLDEEVLGGVEWYPVGKRIWEELEKDDLISPARWQQFVTVYHREALQHSIFKTLLAPPIPFNILPTALSYLSSPRLSFLTSLLLLNTSLTRNEWVSLSQLNNLAILQILGSSNEGPSNLSNQVLRAWSDRDAFPQLRVLEFISQEEITHLSLPYLSAFPLLKVCHMSGRNLDALIVPDLKALGWERLCEHMDNTCSHATSMLLTIQNSLGLPLLKAKSGLQDATLVQVRRMSNVLSLVRMTSGASNKKESKRLLEMSATKSRGVKRPALRKKSKKELGDMLADFLPGHG